MTIADMARLHDATLRAMNVRNYLRRQEQQQERALEQTRDELFQAELLFGQLQAKCEIESAPKLPEVK